MEIKIAAAQDLNSIQTLAETIWPVCYGEIISNDQINYMLHLIYSPQALKTQLQKGHQFIIAMEDNTPIGFASFSKKEDEDPSVFRLHKLYVLTTLHTKGIGGALLNHVCNESKKAGATHLELNVNKHNTAKIFYDKKGFIVLKEEVIDIGNGYVMDDYVMVKKL